MEEFKCIPKPAKRKNDLNDVVEKTKKLNNNAEEEHREDVYLYNISKI